MLFFLSFRTSSCLIARLFQKESLRTRRANRWGRKQKSFPPLGQGVHVDTNAVAHTLLLFHPEVWEIFEIFPYWCLRRKRLKQLMVKKNYTHGGKKKGKLRGYLKNAFKEFHWACVGTNEIYFVNFISLVSLLMFLCFFNVQLTETCLHLLKYSHLVPPSTFFEI